MDPASKPVIVRVHWTRTDQVHSPQAQALLSYWNGLKTAPDRLPKFEDFDFMDVYPIASQLLIRDRVVRDGRPDEFKVRYFGTKIAEWLGRELTGKQVGESFMEDPADVLLSALRTCVAEGCAVRSVGFADHVERREYRHFEALYLPMLGKSGAIEHIVAAANYDYVLREGDL